MKRLWFFRPGHLLSPFEWALMACLCLFLLMIAGCSSPPMLGTADDPPPMEFSTEPFTNNYSR